MKPSAKIYAVLLAVLVSCLPALSQIYKWRDKNGNLVISNVPPPAGVKWEQTKIQGSTPSPKPTAATTGNPAGQGTRELKEYREVKVILYETDWCPYCRKAGEFLKSMGVNLVRYDIDKDQSKKIEKLRKSDGYTGVPLVDVDGILIRGFSEELIKQAVEQKRSE
jgi:glutaredoxin